VALLSFGDYITQTAAGYIQQAHFISQVDSGASDIYAGQLLQAQTLIGGAIDPFPVGVTEYRLSNIETRSSNNTPILVAKIVLLAQYDFDTSTLTTFSGMPTVTEGDTSRQIYGSLFGYTAYSLTAGTANTMEVEYIDQDGNAATWSPAVTLKSTPVPLGSSGFIPLNAGDYGVQDVTDMRFTGAGTYTGTMLVGGVVPICMMNQSTQSTGAGAQVNFLTQKPAPVPLAGGELILLVAFNNTGTTIIGSANLVGVT
jgi:hypothetical protein